MSAMGPPRVMCPSQCGHCPVITGPALGDSGTCWAYAEAGIK
jgi:hypothetical protein